MSEIEFIIFDMDEVFYDYDHQIRLDLLEDLTGRPASDIDQSVWGGPHEAAAEAGTPDTAEGYLKQYGDLLGHPIEFETWVDIRRQMMQGREQMFQLARDLKRHIDLALLTNNGMMLKAALPDCAPEMIEIFGEKAHVSAEFKARKPDPVVYGRVCARYGYMPGRCLFVDDKLENVEGAERAGLAVHHYKTYHGFLSCLHESGLPISRRV
ncbi:MAG: HAD family phosphatase [Roseibium sp.]